MNVTWQAVGTRPSWPRLAVTIAALAVVQPAIAAAQDFDREVAFLTIPTGARPVGMGRAAAALGGDLQSVRWNPAVLSTISDFVPLVSSYDGPLDFGVNQFAAAFPVSRLGVLAVSVEVQSFGDIPLTGSGSPDAEAGAISPNNLILGVGFGRSLVQRLSFGMSVKWIHSELFGSLQGSTFALDAGLFWIPLRQVPLYLGVSALNLGPGLRLDDQPGAQSAPLPGRIRFAAAYDVLGHLAPGKELRFLVAIDLEHAVRDPGTGSQYLGVELGVRDSLFVRGGFVAETLIETNTGVTLGLGLGLGFFRFDLARELGVNQLGDETQLSLSARL
jgi:hypothetical protein